jgi:hypothetical protein
MVTTTASDGDRNDRFTVEDLETRIIVVAHAFCASVEDHRLIAAHQDRRRTQTHDGRLVLNHSHGRCLDC